MTCMPDHDSRQRFVCQIMICIQTMMCMPDDDLCARQLSSISTRIEMFRNPLFGGIAGTWKNGKQMDLEWIRDAWKMENRWALVGNYRFQMENPIVKWDLPFKNGISHFKMGPDGCHGPLGAPEAPPDAHGAHRNPFWNEKFSSIMERHFQNGTLHFLNDSDR